MNMKGKTYSYILMFKRAMLSLCTDKIDTHVVTQFFYCIVFYQIDMMLQTFGFDACSCTIIPVIFGAWRVHMCASPSA